MENLAKTGSDEKHKQQKTLDPESSKGCLISGPKKVK